MADYHADGQFMPGYHEDPEPAAAGPARTMRLAGTALSLAIVAGIGFWGYRMVMRDVSGVPVVRAMTGETRRVPEDSGGTETEFQGLSVNHVAEGGTAAAPANKVTLAPGPVDLGDDALTPAQLGAGQTAQGTPTQLPKGETLEDIASRIATLSDAAAAPVPDNQDDQDDDGAAQLISGKGVGEAVRPKQRPTALATRPASDPATAAAPAGGAAPAAGPIDVAPADVPPGTFLAQVGAFASEAIAKKEWDRLSQDFSIYLQDRKRVIEVAETGGRTFYRLRVMGFSDLSDARRFCATLVAGRVDCIPVLTK
ncbi:SPOR domain-containing protein [Pseudooceanicola sp. CBS1P-1]|uniref:SPOR domain-containing protein n=1 Tax=Pseudooceanicola albus TaxID=2692189 RepID=A0A6L7FW19_9RHOB|nr:MULTISPECIES: SPOR domain-containing protein [Pseudooceanicola]MBT9383373.1 SPOR domain-containing protein [Pseudooceanicola endophyticus]MXN16304.1 SPOR domain-containing protein [Pseudooceanicola albus]